MATTKLESILAAFSEEELAELQEFVNSRLCNCQPKETAAFNRLFAEAEALTPQSITAALRQYEKHFDKDTKYRMVNAIDQYAYIKQALRKSHLHYPFTQEFYAGKKVDRQYNFLMKKARKQREAQAVLYGDDLFAWYLAEKADAARRKVEHHAGRTKDLLSVVRQLDDFYLAEKLMLYIEMLNRNYLLNAGYEIPDIEVLEKQASESATPLVQIYMALIKIITGNNTGHNEYYTIKNYFEQPVTSVGPKQPGALTVIHYLMNYCVEQLNQQRAIAFGEEYLFWIEQLEQRDLLHENGVVDAAIVKNAVTVAVLLEKYNWANKFIKAHEDDVFEVEKEVVINYNKAFVAFARGNYKLAERCLDGLKSKEVYYEMGIRRLQIKVWFEEDNYTMARVFLNRFKDYLKKAPVSQFHQQALKAFIKYGLKMVRRYHEKKAEANLETKLANDNSVAEKEWLQAYLHKKGR